MKIILLRYLARGLQDHKNIELAGYRMDHLLIRERKYRIYN